jgi:hypothetical protein
MISMSDFVETIILSHATVGLIALGIVPGILKRKANSLRAFPEQQRVPQSSNPMHSHSQ